MNDLIEDAFRFVDHRLKDETVPRGRTGRFVSSFKPNDFEIRFWF